MVFTLDPIPDNVANMAQSLENTVLAEITTSTTDNTIPINQRANFLLRTNFLLDFPHGQRYLNPLLGHWLYGFWEYRSMKVIYAILSFSVMVLFLLGQPSNLFMVPVINVLFTCTIITTIGQPSNLFMVPVIGVLFTCTIITTTSTYDRALMRDLMGQFEYGFLVIYIIIFMVMSYLQYDPALYALYSGQTEMVVLWGNACNTTV